MAFADPKSGSIRSTRTSDLTPILVRPLRDAPRRTTWRHRVVAARRPLYAASLCLGIAAGWATGTHLRRLAASFAAAPAAAAPAPPRVEARSADPLPLPIVRIRPVERRSAPPAPGASR